MPEVTIIIPVYNVESFISECLDSIIAQTYTHFEVILVDDGSTDKGGAICDEYATRDNRFRVIHQHNQGLSAARNTGIKAARGRWLAFVDSDDYIEPDYIKVLYETMVEMPEQSIVAIGHRRFTDNDTKTYRLTNTRMEASIIDGIRQMMHNDCFGYACFCIYDKKILTENNLLFSVNQKWEDRYFNLQYLKFIRHVWLLPDVLYNYRIRMDSLSNHVRDWTKSMQSVLDCYHEAQPFMVDPEIANIQHFELLRHLRHIVYHTHSHKYRHLYTDEYREQMYNMFLHYRREFPDTKIIHNPHSPFLAFVHRAVWAFHCRPLIKLFLYLVKV